MMPKSAVRPLETLCIRKIAMDFHRHKHSFKYLPQGLKNDLNNIAGQRERLLEDLVVLEGLLNAQTEMVALDNCHVTDRMLEPVRVCKYLKVLNIGSGATVTTEALCNVFQYTKVLEHFSAKKCPAVNDEVIKTLAFHCPRMSIIDVSDCKDVGDKALINLSDKPLIAINMSGTAVSDHGVAHMVYGQPRECLREVNLDHCNITDKSVELIIRLCQRLSIFSFKNNRFSGDFSAPETLKLKQLVWTVL